MLCGEVKWGFLRLERWEGASYVHIHKAKTVVIQMQKLRGGDGMMCFAFLCVLRVYRTWNFLTEIYGQIL